MKRIFVSVGLAALGASSVSAMDAYSGIDSGKPWSASLSLRGFYSDNIDGRPNGRAGYGFDISPTVRLHLSSPQTDFSAGYTYHATYYDKRPAGNSDNFDHVHSFDFSLQHQFSERYSLTVNDTFVIGQEPDQLQIVGPFASFQRVSGDNIHNYGSIVFDAQLTHLFGIELGYENSYWSYESDKFGWQNVDLLVPQGSFIVPSLSGANDRVEQMVHLDTHWEISPTTVLIVGYQFSDVDYIGEQPVQAINQLAPVSTSDSTFMPIKSNLYYSDIRNSHSHYGYVGANHTFLPNLQGSAKVGIRYTDNYNDPSGSTTIAPYVSLNVSYAYAKESYAQLGFTHDRTSNDRIGGAGVGTVQDSDASTVFAMVHHRITPKFFGTVTGTFQNSEINAPNSPLDGNEDRYYILGVDFEYRFTHYFSMHAGYNYDKLEAGYAGGDYDKNTFYLGATVGY